MLSFLAARRASKIAGVTIKRGRFADSSAFWDAERQADGRLLNITFSKIQWSVGLFASPSDLASLCHELGHVLEDPKHEDLMARSEIAKSRDDPCSPQDVLAVWKEEVRAWAVGRQFIRTFGIPRQVYEDRRREALRTYHQWAKEKFAQWRKRPMSEYAAGRDVEDTSLLEAFVANLDFTVRWVD